MPIEVSEEFASRLLKVAVDADYPSLVDDLLTAGVKVSPLDGEVLKFARRLGNPQIIRSLSAALEKERAGNFPGPTPT